MPPEQLTIWTQKEAWPIPTTQVVAEVRVPRSTLNKAKHQKRLPLLRQGPWGTAQIEYAGHRKGSDYWRVYIA